MAIAVDNLTNAEILTKDEEEENHIRMKSLQNMKTESRVPIENQLADNRDARASECHNFKIEENNMKTAESIKRSHLTAEGNNNDFSSPNVRHNKLSLKLTGVSQLSPEVLTTNEMEL